MTNEANQSNPNWTDRRVRSSDSLKGFLVSCQRLQRQCTAYSIIIETHLKEHSFTVSVRGRSFYFSIAKGSEANHETFLQFKQSL